MVGIFFPLPSWDDFKATLIKRFQPSMLRSPYELLLSLKKMSLVDDYHDMFELYADPLRSEELEVQNHIILKGIFLNGLKGGGENRIRLHSVTTLAEMMHFA